MSTATNKMRVIAYALLCIGFLSTTTTAASSLVGGHVTWRPGPAANQIYIDYQVFFDLYSVEGMMCTEDAIKDGALITTPKKIFMWPAKNPDGKTARSTEITNLSFYCKERSELDQRVVGEFKGFLLNTTDAYFYIGCDDCCCSQDLKGRKSGNIRFGALVDLKPREDTGRINAAPITNVASLYRVEDRINHRIRIPVYDRDHDFVKCRFSKTENECGGICNSQSFFEFEDEYCELSIKDTAVLGKYVIALQIEDFRSKESRKPFSSVGVQFSVEVFQKNKSNEHPEPFFTFETKVGPLCLDIKPQEEYKEMIFATVSGMKDSIKEFSVSGPDGISISGIHQKLDKIDDSQMLSYVVITWKPTMKQMGQHFLCFQASTGKRLRTERRCITLNVGGPYEMKTQPIFPKPGGFSQQAPSSFEIQVHGAIQRPTKNNTYFRVYREDGHLVYKVDLYNNHDYIITEKNRIQIRVDFKKELEMGKKYYVIADKGLFESQIDCVQAPALTDTYSSKSWSFKISNDPAQFKHHLICADDQMSFYINREYYPKSDIERIHLEYNWCIPTEKNNLLVIDAPYNQCGTTMEETEEHIVYKNVASMYFGNETNGIVRPLEKKIELVCRMKKKNKQTIGVKRLAPQSIVAVDPYRSYGTFTIDFNLYQSMRFIQTYTKKDFPIIVGSTERIYLEIAMNKRNKKRLRMIPQNCYATIEPDVDATVRHNIIEDRCPKDKTLVVHKMNAQQFQYSIAVFDFKKSAGGIYIHCETFICHNNTDERCTFGCNKKTRSRREAIVGRFGTYLTSSYYINIKADESSYGESAFNPVLLAVMIALVAVLAVIGLKYTLNKRKMFQRKSKNLLEMDPLHPDQVQL